MSALQPLEDNLNDLFVKKSPALPEAGKKALVEYLPWINLVFGVISLLLAWGLYHSANYVNNAVSYVNSLSQAYGGPAVAVSHVTLTVWLAIAALAVEGALYLMAFPATKARSKRGWDLMFYALLFNLVYGVIAAFTNYGGVGRLVGAVISSAVGGYLLFQIRSSYLKQPAATTPAVKA